MNHVETGSEKKLLFLCGLEREKEMEAGTFFPTRSVVHLVVGGGGEVKAEALHLDGMDKIVIAVLSI